MAYVIALHDIYRPVHGWTKHLRALGLLAAFRRHMQPQSTSYTSHHGDEKRLGPWAGLGPVDHTERSFSEPVTVKAEGLNTQKNIITLSTYFTSAADEWHQIHTYGIHTLDLCSTSLFFPYSSWVRLVRKYLNMEMYGDCRSSLFTYRLILSLKQINTDKALKPKFKLNIAIDSIVQLSPTIEI